MNNNIKTKTAVIFLFLVFLFSVPVFSQNIDRVSDNAGLLNNAEAEELRRISAVISQRYSFDLIILTVRDLGSYNNVREYAEAYFVSNGYGQGGSRQGCLLLNVTGTRDYWFTVSPRGARMLTETAFGELDADVLSHLRRNAYFQAYREFMVKWEKLLELEARGRRYNFFYKWNAVITTIAWIISIAIGFIVVSSWKGAMNTVLPKTQAAGYMVPDSLNFTAKNDTFLYSTVTKTKRQKESSSGKSISSGGGGMVGRGGKY